MSVLHMRYDHDNLRATRLVPCLNAPIAALSRSQCRRVAGAIEQALPDSRDPSVARKRRELRIAWQFAVQGCILQYGANRQDDDNE